MKRGIFNLPKMLAMICDAALVDIHAAVEIPLIIGVGDNVDGVQRPFLTYVSKQKGLLTHMLTI
jgi:hypothetical protein